MNEHGDGARRDAAWSNPLGDYIKAQRQLAKLSLREMASLTSVSNAYLSQIERGLHQPSLKVLQSIAEALQLSMEQLLDRGGWSRGDVDGESTAAARPAAPTTEDVIRADPRLTREQREALLRVYRSFVGSD